MPLDTPDLVKDPRELTNLWNDPTVAAVQHGMLTDLLQVYFQVLVLEREAGEVGEA